MATGANNHGFVNVETYGQGKRQVIALHCALGRAASWRPISRVLEDATVTAPDWPGHGKSEPWLGQGLMRAAAVGIVEDTVGDGPVDLVGHSYGGVVALDYATRHPEKVRSLALIEPIFLAVVGQDDRPVLDAYLEHMQPHFDALAAQENEDAARFFMEIWGGGITWDKLPEEQRAALTAQIPVVDACKPGDESSPEELEVLQRLDQLSMPIQLVYGDRTLEVVQAAMVGLHKRLRHSQVTKVEKAGHMLPLTHPQMVADLLQALWEG